MDSVGLASATVARAARVHASFVAQGASGASMGEYVFGWLMLLIGFVGIFAVAYLFAVMVIRVLTDSDTI